MSSNRIPNETELRRTPSALWLWLAWTLGTAFAWGIGGPLGVIAGGSGGLIVVTLMAYALGALLAGIVQSYFVARILPAGSWVLASVASVVIMVVLAIALGSFGSEAGLLGVTLLGPTLGLLQWRLLKKRLSKAWCWILASILGWVLGGFAIAMESLNMDANPSFPSGWIVLGTLNGAITGFTLVLLMRRTRRENTSSRKDG